MCVVSMIADDFRRHHPNIDDYWKWGTPLNPTPTTVGPSPTRQEFEDMKRELEELKKRLEIGKQEDIDNGEPDCEMDEKIEIFRRLGELFGIDFNEVLKSNAS